MTHLVLLACALTLAGCANAKAPYPFNPLYLVLDKGIVLNGSLTIDPDCKVTIQNQPKAE